MCGISGYISSQYGFRERLGASLSALRHRGPDDIGTVFFRSRDSEIGLGSTRLSILDLSSAGHMPMSTADGLCSIVFNGEIYDAPLHRRELERRGITFRSRTDTEVLLYGLALDGPDFLNRIDGMYAFALWDSRKVPGLLLARDRFGEKPLFFHSEKDGTLCFASELPALLRLLGQTPEVDPDGVRHLLNWGYPRAGKSIFRGIHKLAPGTWQWFGERSGNGFLSALGSTPVIDAAQSVPEAAGLIREALECSVRDRLVADVPVGVFLSGGIDSAGIAALAIKSLPPGKRLNTYTVGYPGSDVSELESARRTARWLGTNHEEITIDSERLAALPFVAASLGEPVADPAALPTYFLSAIARRTATVLLTGEGADEIFFGYPRYLLHDLADRVPSGPLLARTYSFLAARTMPKLVRAPECAPERDRLWKNLGWSDDGLLANDVASDLPDMAPRNGDLAARWARNDDLARWLHENVLARVDRMTMAASIESRSPYLAREVARLGLNLQDDVLRRFPFGKVALRAALKPWLPARLRWVPKRPFAVPLVDWMRGPLRPLFDDVFFGERLLHRGWLQSEGLRAIGHAVLVRDPRAARIAWTILVLELWARAHLDGEVPVPPDTFCSVAATAAKEPVNRRQLVLAVDFPPAVGGIQLYNKELLDHGGLGDVSVIAPGTPGDVDWDRTFPGQILRLTKEPGLIGSVRYLAAVAAIMPWRLRCSPTVHVAHISLAPSVLPYVGLFGSPVIVWTYALELTDPRLRFTTHAMLRRADRVVVISEYTRGLALERGACADRIVKISPGGDDLLRRFPLANAERFRQRYAINPDEFLILSVGRISPNNRYKGFDRVIEVASILQARSRRFRWLVVGSGPDIEFYRAAVESARLAKVVAFVGLLDDAILADAYSACDLFCLFSRSEVTARGILSEGYGIVYVQAGSFGKPVLGLKRGGVVDAVKHDETGILVDEDDPQMLADAVETMMDSDTQRELMGQHGLRYAMGEGSWARAREKFREMVGTL